MSGIVRVLARSVGLHGGVPVYAFGCGGVAPSGPPPATRFLMRFLGTTGGSPLFGYSTCEFPRMGRYLMRFVGMSSMDGLPIYALGCCLDSGSGSSSGSSGFSGSSGDSWGDSGSSDGSGSSGDGSGFGSSSGDGSSYGSLSESGMGSSSGGSGGGSCSCPDYPWSMEGFNGATWSGGDWSVRISFEDSSNCGGTNSDTQHGNASRRVCLCAPTRLTINMIGLIERQDTGYEQAETRVNGTLICSGASVGEGLGCLMATVSVSGTIDLPAGDHLIELTGSTIDGAFHTGAYWEFGFTWEPI